MKTFRLVEISDTTIKRGKVYWRIEKLILGLYWSSYFGAYWGSGCYFFNKDEAMGTYKDLCSGNNKTTRKILEQNQN